jgi:hypothetical protein
VNLTITLIALFATVAAAVAALGSWKAAATANKTTAQLAAIERDRRHEELTPQLQVAFLPTANAPGYADLRVMLTGGGLERLDEVTVTILDEALPDHWAHGLPQGVTEAEAALFVWGPWQFNTGATEQVASNRQSKPRPLTLGGRNADNLSMVRTKPGHWMTDTDEAWRRAHLGPLRLRLTCHCAGYKPWTLFQDVPVQPPRPGFS